jgi:hypothetical protein
VGHLPRIDSRPRRDHVDHSRIADVPQHREVVNVHFMFEDAVGPDDRNRRRVGIGAVLINRHAVAVTN